MADGADYDYAGAEWFKERLGKEVLLVQGPMGSELMQSALSQDVPAAYWNLADPETVERIHWLYRTVGADVMLTNTFQASAPALARDDIHADVARVNRSAVFRAKRAGAPCVLGSIGPCGLSWLKRGSDEYLDAVQAYRQQAIGLLGAGAHGVFLETFTSLRDLEPALLGALEVSEGLPVLVSFAIDDEANLLGDGQNIEAACMFAAKHGASSVGVNCCSLDAAQQVVGRMRRAVDLPISVRPNAGMPARSQDGAIRWTEDPEGFARACPGWIEAGATLVGSCCGAGVRTTSALASVLDERYR